MSDLTLFSVNVRGIRDKIKRKAIFEWLKEKEGKVILLQETYSTPDIEDVWKQDWPGQMFFSHGSNHSKGVLILISPGVDFKIDGTVQDIEGRYVFLKGDLQGITLVLGGVYFPTRDKVNEQVEFLEKLDDCISELYSFSDSLVLGGDFNVVLNESLDHMGGFKLRRTNFVNRLDVFLRKYDVGDIWRKRNPNVRKYTFRQKTPLVQSRLDYWFISKKLENLVVDCDILPSITPDHLIITLQLRRCKEEVHYGKSYWKFNNSLCLDKEFVEGMVNEIKTIKRVHEHEFRNKSIFWDFLKMKMRQYARKFSKQKAKDRKDKIEKLENEISHLENGISTNFDCVEKIETNKAQLKKLYESSLEGIKIRSRAAWYEEGEQNKEYFEQLLASNKKKTLIKELYNEMDTVITDRKEILQRIRSFYENLYSKKLVLGSDDYFFRSDIPTLSKENQDLCEGKITIEECLNVLKTMKLNKSPGNDGLTVEFYLTFWSYIGGILVEVFNEAYERGDLSTSQKQGVITLVEKDGKDPRYIKNYRPITLLNVDYKILSKVLANRMKTVLSEIIKSDQVGYMKDRNIGEAIRLIDDMIFHCLTNDINSFLIAVDFEKAFDSVSHQFLCKVLELFGFGVSFRTWVKTLYNDISSCVMNGGFSTGYFEIGRGVRQGDPLSPYLFLIVIEILAHAVRNDSTIKGINLENYEVKQVLYADDMTIFVRDKDSVKNLKVIFHSFQKISGLKVNMEKTNIVWIGKEREGLGVEIPSFGNLVKEVKILGVYFSVDRKMREELNYKEILSKIKRLLGWWKQRDLSMIGKIHLLKTYALSKLNYIISSIVVPSWLYKEIKKVCFEFIWKGKDRIKRQIMYQDFGDGGLRMWNFDLFVKTQRVMWVKRLLYGEKCMVWKKYFEYAFRLVGGTFIFHCNYDVTKLSLKVPPFYLEMLKAWQELEDLRMVEDQMNQIIFNNKYFLIKGKMIYNENLHMKDIYQLSHCFNEDGIRPIAHFHGAGLNSWEIANVWRICEVVLKSERYDWALVNTESHPDNEFIWFKLFGKIVRFCDISSRKIYQHFVSSLQESYTLQVRDGHSNFQFDGKILKEIFRRPRSTTLIRKLREFQFKLLHGVVYTKEHLLKFGFAQDNLCSFCKLGVETYLHLFWDCVKVKELWQQVTHKLELLELKDVSWEVIHVGIQGNSLRIKCCNSIIFMLKHILYLSRSEGKVPSIDQVHKKLLEYREEEYKIASKCEKIGLHLLKWESVNVS